EDPEESFYVCKWSVCEATGAPLLMLAGQNGVVRIIDCSTETLVATLCAHGNSINDITVLPQRPSLFLTASKDESIRLWNLKTRTCVLIMSGDGGHTNEVLTLDFHPWDQRRFVSAGMDNTVKVWSLAEHSSTVEQSLTWESTTAAFPTAYVHRPLFSSSQVHANYVDCVRWLGDLVLSKSVDFEILTWRPRSSDEPGVHVSTSFQLLQRFPLPESRIWFVRFSLDASFTLLACGNRTGKVYLYNPHDPAPRTAQLQCLKSKNNGSVVRQTAVSASGNIVLAACEDGTIWRWDRLDKASKEAAREGGASEAPSAAGTGSLAVSGEGDEEGEEEQGGKEGTEEVDLEDGDYEAEVQRKHRKEAPELPGR
ncbi:hypothetical protein FOA52_009559, partial [Chlamydomonas sp. UWO 241]